MTNIIYSYLNLGILNFLLKLRNPRKLAKFIVNQSNTKIEKVIHLI